MAKLPIEIPEESMANKPIIMSKIRQILKLYAKGIGKKKIAGRLSVSKNTVKHYIEFFVKLRMPLSDLERKSDLELSNLFHPPLEKDVGDKLQKLYEFFPRP